MRTAPFYKIVMAVLMLALTAVPMIVFADTTPAAPGATVAPATPVGVPIPSAPSTQPITPPPAPAPVKINSGDTAFVLMGAAMVLLMTPGLALFYGGMVRRKNALSTMMQSFIVMGLVSVQWALFGYSLAFGPDIGGGLLGSLAWIGLKGVGFEPHAGYAATIPHQVFMIFQAMFAIITIGLVTGSFAERMKFSAFLLFAILWTTIVYDPICHWVWSVGADGNHPGWIRKLGALDFAGGTVVHISSGISALIVALVIGKRKGYGTEAMAPHSLTLTLVGTGLLWFGWFGFNAASALAANELAGSAFIVTNFAAAAASLSWLFIEWITRGRPTVLGALSGAVAGLVAITPASGFVSTMPALFIGFAAGIVCFFGVTSMKHLFGYDDSLDAVGVHGLGGTLGALLTGFFATKLVNPAGADGLFYGNAALLKAQFIAVGATMAYAAVMTFILIKIVDAIIGIRVSHEDEITGLDYSQHGESAYNM